MKSTLAFSKKMCVNGLKEKIRLEEEEEREREKEKGFKKWQIARSTHIQASNALHGFKEEEEK